MTYEDAMLRCPRGHKMFTVVERATSGEIKIDEDLQTCSCGAEMKHIPLDEITDGDDIIQITDNALESANHHNLSAPEMWIAILKATRKIPLDPDQQAAVARGIHAYLVNL
jgi:hypothetical protein